MFDHCFLALNVSPSLGWCINLGGRKLVAKQDIYVRVVGSSRSN